MPLPTMPRPPIDGAFDKEGDQLPTRPPVPWEKGDMLGQGSFGRVYKGTQMGSGRVIAVKEFALESGAPASQLAAIAEEVRGVN